MVVVPRLNPKPETLNPKVASLHGFDFITHQGLSGNSLPMCDNFYKRNPVGICCCFVLFKRSLSNSMTVMLFS